MNKPVTPPPPSATENTGPTGRRRPPVPVEQMPAIQPDRAGSCSCSSSMASQPTFDLQVPGRPDSSAMDWFVRGYDTGARRHGGYGRSTKTRDNNAPIQYGRRLLRRRDLSRIRASARSGLRIVGRARSLPSSTGSLRSRSTHVDRRRLADACRSPPAAARIPVEEPAAHRPRLRASILPAPSRHRRQCRDRAFADAIRSTIGADRHLCDMCAPPVCDPEKIKAATIVMRGEYDGIAGLGT